jgi:hypothetical protein
VTVTIPTREPRTLRRPTPDEAARGIKFAHFNKNFTVYRKLIEGIRQEDRFRVETHPKNHGPMVYEMSRADFERTLPHWVSSDSYQWMRGCYYTQTAGEPLAELERFRV